MTEETITKRQIKDYLNLKGIFWWYNLAGIGSQKGIPDLCALKDGKLYMIEVKTSKGFLSKYQTEFLSEARKNGAIIIVARDLESVRVHF